MIVEIKLDNLDNMALSQVIRPTRDIPHNTRIVSEIKRVAGVLLANDTVLLKLEEKFSRDCVNRPNSSITKSVLTRVSSILRHLYTGMNLSGGGYKGILRGKNDYPRPRRVTEENDPPTRIEFDKDVFYIHDFSSKANLLTKRESKIEREVFVPFWVDARSTRYRFSFKNLNIPGNIIATYIPINAVGKRIHLLENGYSEINRHGMGAVVLIRDETLTPVENRQVVGKLVLTIKASDGSIIKSKVDIGLNPMRRSLPRATIHYQAKIPSGNKGVAFLKNITEMTGLTEDSIEQFDYPMEQQSKALNLTLEDTSYVCQKVADTTGGDGLLTVRINIGNAELLKCLNRLKGEKRANFFNDYLMDIVSHGFLTQFDMTAFDSDKKNAIINDLRKEVFEMDNELNRPMHYHCFINHVKTLETLNQRASEQLRDEFLARKTKDLED